MHSCGCFFAFETAFHGLSDRDIPLFLLMRVHNWKTDASLT